MEYNIDILVAGCNTACTHCYVNGGKAPSMQIEDFKYCMEKLEPVFAHFGKQISFTLDNELYNHPNVKEILELVEQKYSKNYYHHGSTTGIAILEHPNREEIFEILKRNDWLEVSFAIHGGRETHDEMVNCNGALEAIIKASRLFKENGFEVWLSLMISKKFVEDLPEVAELLGEILYDHILPVIPDYYPNSRLMKYQEIRCANEEYGDVIDFFKTINVPTADVEIVAEKYNEESVLQHLEPKVLGRMLAEKETAFFHINQNLDFYIGNTGSAQRFGGNLRECSAEKIIQWMESSADNFYETATIHYEDILEAASTGKLVRSKENYVYPNEVSAIIAMIQNGRNISK